MYTCIKCGTNFSRDRKFVKNSLCPISNCSGKIAEIDDNLALTIHLLNKKGYVTQESCSGHTWGGDTYITFNSNVRISDIPNGFKSKFDSSGRLKISKTILGSDIDRLKSINDAAIVLLDWATSVPTALEALVQFDVKSKTGKTNIRQEIQKQLHLFNLCEYDKIRGENYQTFLYVSPELVESLKNEIENFGTSNDTNYNFLTMG
jgi:hypothetical protein